MKTARTRTAVAALLALAAAGPARADNLDAAIVANAGTIQTFLKDSKVRNVGVLNFAVRKGGGKDSFSLGTLSTTVPTRLVPALVVSNHPSTPVGVIADANAVAAEAKLAWHAKPADRARLFARDHPLAWGTTKVKPDALLTGRVEVSDDLATLTVVVEAYLATAPATPVPVTTFKVKTDRTLLRELGQSFAVPRDAGKTRGERDRQAVADARRRDLAPGNDLSPDNVAGIRFRVLYDGVAQTIRADERSPGEWQVNPPTAGQKVALEIGQNGQAKETLGVLLRVNGRSVWQQSTAGDDDGVGIWIMATDQPAFAFGGFFMSKTGDNLLPFRVLTEEESASRAAELGERVGLFDVDVFASRPGNADGEVLAISRGLTRGAKGQTAKTGEELRNRLFDENKLLLRAMSGQRGVVDADGQAVAGPEVPGGALDNRQRIGRLTVRYYDPKGSGAMQISK